MSTRTYTSPFPTDEASWDMAKNGQLAYSAVAGETLSRLANDNPNIVVLTADLQFSNRTSDFASDHPDRFFNVGISEQHMVTMAAGLATTGYIPYVATFASFVGLLCAEQIRTDLAYPGLPVRVLAHHAGISLGYYGTSHHATEDIATTRAIANLTVLSLADGPSTAALIEQTVDVPGPVYFRIGRGREANVYENGVLPQFGSLASLREGTDLLVISTGAPLRAVIDAADELAKDGYRVAAVDAHTLRPFPADGFRRLAAQFSTILVVEEHNIYGGLASICADALLDGSVSGVRLIRHGLPVDEYSLIGPPFHLYQHYGLDTDGIAKQMRAAIRTSEASR